MKVKSVNEYIAAKPKNIQRILREIRSIVRRAVPAAEEVISYQIPAYRVDGRLFLFFAAWKQHYSLYPAGARLVDAFKKELAPYKLSKGTVRFPYSEPMPKKLIERIAKFRARETENSNQPKRGAARKKGSGQETQLERVRRICAGMPSAFEKTSHGAPTFFVEKDKGVFVMFMDNHHSDGHLAIWVPAKPGMQKALIEDAPQTYFKPPYVGSSGWIGIELNQIGDEALAIHVREGWDLSSVKKKRARRQESRE
jgi:uncharacterized protein YdhG (YjbR/CyaY superfamily)